MQRLTNCLVFMVTASLISGCGDSKEDPSQNNDSGIQCEVKADCADQLDGALDPDNVECRLDPSTGDTGCFECIDDSECPNLYACRTNYCLLTVRGEDQVCQTVEDCSELAQTDFFLRPESVMCPEMGEMAGKCVECESDDDCEPGEQCLVEPTAAGGWLGVCYTP